MITLKETSLYVYVKELFEKIGYQVKSEVKNIDVIASKGSDITIIEMKTSLNLTLILQATKRQRISETVYVAIPKPSFKIRCSDNFKDKEYLLRRLSLGLIFVDLNSESPHAYIHFEPSPFNNSISMGKSKTKKEKILREYKGRSHDLNVGGTNKKIMTAYKENALLIAYLIDKHGPINPKKLSELGGGEKTQSILSKNFYGWFLKIKRGIYDLTDSGKKAAEEYEKKFI